MSPPAHQRSALESIHLIYEISTPRRQTSRKQHEVLWLLVTELLDPLFFFLGILGSLGIICLVILCSSTFTLMQFPRHPNPAQCHLSETDKNCRWQKKVIWDTKSKRNDSGARSKPWSTEAQFPFNFPLHLPPTTQPTHTLWPRAENLTENWVSQLRLQTNKLKGTTWSFFFFFLSCLLMLPCCVYVYFALEINKMRNSIIGRYWMERTAKLYQWWVRMKKKTKKEVQFLPRSYVL